ncbi:RNA demethylase ALKBH10B-like [Zingiber officinale]|uniref:RNA demethylase ALKBH10B-like n=1 Tax=Zingiber officinale TaxID=94328 RepID=UPI001C4D654E|nr:RNA demethylase ALKBH10B-like [Zingiber officinale]
MARTATSATAVPELYSRDAMIAWLRSEFAAANAIIDALCSHLVQIRGAAEYESVFAAVHWRRLNWIPVLNMQKFYSIDDVSAELHSVVAKFPAVVPEEEKPKEIYILPSEEEKPAETDIPPTKEEIAADEETVAVGVEIGTTEEAAAEEETWADAIYHGNIKVARIEEKAATETEVSSRGGAWDFQGAADGYANKGSQEEQGLVEEVKVCADLGVCLVRPERIKISKGFVAKESVKGHMVNVVKGLKLYENIFAGSELPTLVEYINELRLAGRRGELPGETFIFFNKQMKGNKREIIQLGVPLFQSATGEAESIIEPIPPALLTIIDHLVQWRLVPESKKPNSCIINFFDEDEHSQPYFKPPHLENPISTLLLSGTTMAFGRSLISDYEGNYKGSLTLPIKEGSLLVMRGNSADMARHVVCASPNKRISITFVKVRTATQHSESPIAIQSNKAMTLWQPGHSTPLQKMTTGGGIIAYRPNVMIPATWGLALRTPIVMLAPPGEVVVNPDEKIARNGTGVFLPWMIRPKKYTKHLPPRIQKRRLLSLPSTLEAQA